MALISLDHVSKVYPRGTRPALDDITLHVERGDFVFLVGASGSGKTTLLSLLLREEEATDGEIRVAGNDLRRLTNRQVPQYRRSIGFVFQDYKLLNNKTVWQNVAFALEVIGTSRATIKSVVPKVLDTVGLTGKENSYPHELSGGEQQRVAIARAYVNHPQILLADEPTGNLDPTTSLGIMEVLDAINRTGTTVVMATHNEEIVNSMRKRVVELHNGVIVRDEAQGSYDSALYFPDAEVESRAQLSIGANDADARFKSNAVRGVSETDIVIDETVDRRTAAVHAADVVSQAVLEGAGDEGIARLAQSVHSGRTGRYGEAFAPVENTLTWGRGLTLDEYAQSKQAEQSDSQLHESQPELISEETEDGDGAQETSYSDTPQTEQEDAALSEESLESQEPVSVSTGDENDTVEEVVPPLPPAPPAPPMPPVPGERKHDSAHTEEEN